MDKIGLSFTGQLSYNEMYSNVRRAKELGFSSIWLAEHYFYRDAFASIAALGSSFDGLTFGTGIVSPYTRHIGLLAMGAQTLSEITGGRFVLGLGTNSRFWKVLGISDPHPLGSIRESVTTLRSLLSGGATQLSRASEQQHEGGDAKLGFTTSTTVPIYIGAIGYRMLRLSAQIADGVLLSAGSAPEYAREAVSSLRRDLKESGRTNFEMASYIISLSDEDAKTRNQAKERLVGLLSLKGREKMLGRMAHDERVPKMREVLASGGTVEAASRFIGDDILDHVSISGPPSRRREKVEEFREAGVSLPILSPVGGRDFSSLLESVAK
ncbi:MAG TPA: LLM class flavin-dependent oxidoreductase [Nitrososphaerales archaeon]|nr:LLM class flavin-dependent oxidoreductase [Nitrososphaerales archaeon]